MPRLKYECPLSVPPLRVCHWDESNNEGVPLRGVWQVEVSWQIVNDCFGEEKGTIKMIYFQKKYLYMIYTIASMPIEVMSCYNNFVTMYD